ncbi:MAG: MFS transporter [Cardiobacteriaceae bacterium]|nr:MFS transporter [Cardiobacteriaceae bacterium]
MTQGKKSWREALAVYLERRSLVMLGLGFFAGVPILLIFSSLSLWLSEAGIKRSEITMFSLAGLAYSFKFVWAPLIDHLPLPALSQRLGRRRGWLLVAQLGIIAAICFMALVNPALPDAPRLMALAAILLGFASATQDIVIDAYRIEIGADDHHMQPVFSATYVAGYRLGMIVAGAGALFLAERFGSSKEAYAYDAWRNTYFLMAAVMAAGVLLTCFIPEPKGEVRRERSAGDNLRLVLLFAVSVAAFVAAFIFLGKNLSPVEGAFHAFLRETLRFAASTGAAGVAAWLLVQSQSVPAPLVQETWVEPVADFFRRYGKAALLLLALIGFFRVSDIVAGVVSNLFYEHLGFSKSDIAKAVKFFGVIASIVGGFVGGIFAQRYSMMRMMMIAAILTASTNLLFSLMEWTGAYQIRAFDMPVALYAVVGFDNLAAGFASAVFVAFLSALTSIRFTAMQYAIFGSLMTLFPKLLGAYSGGMVDALKGYPAFFAMTAALGIPVLLLVWLNDKVIFSKQKDQ